MRTLRSLMIGSEKVKSMAILLPQDYYHEFMFDRNDRDTIVNRLHGKFSYIDVYRINGDKETGFEVVRVRYHGQLNQPSTSVYKDPTLINLSGYEKVSVIYRDKDDLPNIVLPDNTKEFERTPSFIKEGSTFWERLPDFIYSKYN